jgi:hypothetical protein
MGDVTENPGGYVYGTILVATLLAAERATHDSYARVAERVAVALVLYWLAVSYAEYVGHRAQGAGEHFSPRGFMRLAVHELALLTGALGPLLAVLGCWAAGARLETGISIAVWSAAAVILATEVALGVRSHLDGIDLVVQTAFGVLFGLLVIAMRVLLH